MNSQLLSICKQKQDTTRVGFSSSEFEELYNQTDFKGYINKLVVERIKNNIEGRCIGEGYVIPDTVNLVERSTISFPHESLQLHYSMNVRYEYMLCNPNPGVILQCVVVTKNKIGILGKLNDEKSPLVILIPLDLCDTPEKMSIVNQSKVGDIVNIEVIGKKFEQNDKKITVIAEISL